MPHRDSGKSFLHEWRAQRCSSHHRRPSLCEEAFPLVPVTWCTGSRVWTELATDRENHGCRAEHCTVKWHMVRCGRMACRTASVLYLLLNHTHTHTVRGRDAWHKSSIHKVTNYEKHTLAHTHKCQERWQSLSIILLPFTAGRRQRLTADQRSTDTKLSADTCMWVLCTHIHLFLCHH